MFVMLLQPNCDYSPQSILDPSTAAGMLATITKKHVKGGKIDCAVLLRMFNGVPFFWLCSHCSVNGFAGFFFAISTVELVLLDIVPNCVFSGQVEV